MAQVRTPARDCVRIDVSRDVEVRDWSRSFGVTPERLKAAVAAVGDKADEVRRHLSGASAPEAPPGRNAA